jgi:hypothetical protein
MLRYVVRGALVGPRELKALADAFGNVRDRG